MAEQKFGWRRDYISETPGGRRQDQADKEAEDARDTAPPKTPPAKTPTGPIPKPKP